MSSLLFGIGLSALLSVTSLVVVLFRVSPLTAPEQALPAFFASLLLAVSSVSAIALFYLWRLLPAQTWDTGKILSISVRQGIFIGLATTITVLFFLLGLLTWWVALLIFAVFVLIELAIHS